MFFSEKIQRNVFGESWDRLHDCPPNLSLFCCFQISNEPSAPSCDLLDLSPTLPTPVSNGEALNTVNAQLSALSK